MYPLKDPNYLRAHQYQDSANLSARAALHQRFSTNPHGWLRWAFDQLLPHLRGRVLEVGGGPGWLWRENAERLPAGVRLCFSDLSTGMAHEARAALPSATFTVANLDAQDLPFPNSTFQAVVANHMLYHVPDLPRAVRGLARVLAPGGRLFAATNGRRHLAELTHLAREFEPGFAADLAVLIDSFSLETAPAALSAAFAHVELHRYPDALWVTEARPLAAYIGSMSTASDFISRDRLGELEAFFQARITRDGGVRITKDAGYALAWND